MIRVASGTHPEEAFGPAEPPGTTATGRPARTGMPFTISGTADFATDSIGEGDDKVRYTPFIRHFLRTMIAPVVFESGMDTR